ncbi:hypothetical protein MSMTP_2201 [Methanosarcina sp. MTP4]|nr:hypothetical protein MSMTP_2201 [Methanosarcina sp. MTP4]
MTAPSSRGTSEPLTENPGQQVRIEVILIGISGQESYCPKLFKEEVSEKNYSNRTILIIIPEQGRFCKIKETEGIEFPGPFIPTYFFADWKY